MTWAACSMSRIFCWKSAIATSRRRSGSVKARLSGKSMVIYIMQDLNLTIQTSNSDRGSCDCRIIDCSVPIFKALWLGTGTVIVVSSARFCITIWLPRWRTIWNPCCSRSLHISCPEKVLSLPNANLQPGNKDFGFETIGNFWRIGNFKEKLNGLD